MHHTRALILRKDEWNEADVLVTALTRDFGKIRLLAQGARKLGAKLQGHLEPGSIAEVSFVIGRNGYRLTTAHLLEFFPDIRASFSKLRALFFVLGALDVNLWEERERAEELFGVVEEALAALEGARRLGTVRRIIVWFVVRFFGLLGVFPPPGSAEAAHASSLFVLAERHADEVDTVATSEEGLEGALRLVVGHLGSAVHLPHARAFADLAI